MLKINDNFSNQYIEALTIVFTEGQKTWELFTKNVPMFNEINCERDIRLIAEKVHHKYINIITSSKKQYDNWWKKEKYGVMEILNKYFKQPNSDITAYVCLTPLFTRNIETYTFLLPTNADKLRFYNIVTHELIHFYYYNELKESIIEVDEDISWKISELMIEPIIKYLFPDYIYENQIYSFSKKDKEYADKTVKLFLDNKISFIELIRRMENEYTKIQ